MNEPENATYRAFHHVRLNKAVELLNTIGMKF